MTPSLVLASASPRRSAILGMLGLEHEVVAPDVLEELQPHETPAAHVERLAREKAAAVARARPGALVLGGDTVVVLGGVALGKPSDEAEAVAMLLRLGGHVHVVHTALALAEPGGLLRSRIDRTRVRFRPLTRSDAEAYVATGEPMDKAGAYGIQGLGAALVDAIEGDFFTVMGLPVAGLLSLLADAGWCYAFGGLEALPDRPGEALLPAPNKPDWNAP